MATAQFFCDLEDYLTEEFHFGDTAKAFLAEYAPLFAQHLLGDGGGNLEDDIPMVLYDAFLRYQQLLEAKLVLFLERRDIEPRQFYTWCRDALAVSEADGGHREFIQILCASETFELFFDLMSETVRMQSAMLSLESEDASTTQTTNDAIYRDEGKNNRK